MNRRTLLFGAGALGLGATAAGAWLRPGSSATAQIADPFDELRRRFRTFRTVLIDFQFGGGVKCVLAASSSGRVAMRIPQYGWYLWREERLTRVSDALVGDACPRREDLPLPPMLPDLWTELRSGFANSLVTATRPEDLGVPIQRWGSTGPEQQVRMISLAPPWAQNLRLFARWTLPDQVQDLLLVHADGSDVPTRAPFGEPVSRLWGMRWAWNVPLPAGIFTEANVRLPEAGRHATRWGNRGPARRDHERCEVEGGHHHGDDLEREHTFEEIEGCGPPQSRTTWTAACERPDPGNPCLHPPHPDHPPHPEHPEHPPHPQPPPHPEPPPGPEGKGGKGRGGGN